MAANEISEALQRQLHADSEQTLYAVLDGASIPVLLELIDEHEPEHACLFSGDLHPELEQTAPYLVKLEPDSAFSRSVVEQGWGNHWGIFVTVPKDVAFVAVRKHFRTFLRVRDPDGKLMLFRYYDPRVLRVYLPTCNDDESATLFGPVTGYMVEADDEAVMLRFSPDKVGSDGDRVALGAARR